MPHEQPIDDAHGRHPVDRQPARRTLVGLHKASTPLAASVPWSVERIALIPRFIRLLRLHRRRSPTARGSSGISVAV
jgi:hypothetical protein